MAEPSEELPAVLRGLILLAKLIAACFALLSLPHYLLTAYLLAPIATAIRGDEDETCSARTTKMLLAPLRLIATSLVFVLYLAPPGATYLVLMSSLFGAMHVGWAVAGAA